MAYLDKTKEEHLESVETWKCDNCENETIEKTGSKPGYCTSCGDEFFDIEEEMDNDDFDSNF